MARDAGRAPRPSRRAAPSGASRPTTPAPARAGRPSRVQSMNATVLLNEREHPACAVRDPVAHAGAAPLASRDGDARGSACLVRSSMRATTSVSTGRSATTIARAVACQAPPRESPGARSPVAGASRDGTTPRNPRASRQPRRARSSAAGACAATDRAATAVAGPRARFDAARPPARAPDTAARRFATLRSIAGLGGRRTPADLGRRRLGELLHVVREVVEALVEHVGRDVRCRARRPPTSAKTTTSSDRHEPEEDVRQDQLPPHAPEQPAAVPRDRRAPTSHAIDPISASETTLRKISSERRQRDEPLHEDEHEPDAPDSRTAARQRAQQIQLARRRRHATRRCKRRRIGGGRACAGRTSLAAHVNCSCESNHNRLS